MTAARAYYTAYDSFKEVAAHRKMSGSFDFESLILICIKDWK